MSSDAVKVFNLLISRKLQSFMKEAEIIAEVKFGKKVGLGVVVFPWADENIPEGTKVPFQYISNAPREHMHGALDALVKHWDKEAKDIPHHQEHNVE